MTIQEVNTAYSRIIAELDRKALKNAFDDLLGLIAGTNQYNFQDKLNELQDTYKALLHYRTKGVQDPMQDEIYQKIQVSAYELAEQVRLHILTRQSSAEYFAKRRKLQAEKETFRYEDFIRVMHDGLNDVPNPEGVPPRKRYKAALSLLFYKIWVSDRLTSAEWSQIQQIMDSQLLPVSVRCMVVSALQLSLEEQFDVRKILLLIHAMHSAEDEVVIRGAIALLLALYKYKNRIALYPLIEEELRNCRERYPESVKATIQLFEKITIGFILARETEKISRKLQDEILPEMMKLDPILGKKINLKDLTPESLSDEMNPEWQDSIFANKNFGDKMVEFSELQMEGADILHSTFVHLKNYPFFSEMCNWFLLFNGEFFYVNTEYEKMMPEWKLFDEMSDVSFMCDSDKFSLFFSMLHLPEETRKMMFGQVNGEIKDFIRENKDEIVSRRSKTEQLSGRYIQDLYRFYKLYPNHAEFDDIFAYPLDFHNLPVLAPYFSNTETLTTIAEYYLRKNHFQDALNVYERLLADNPKEEILYQKAGYCRQMEGDWKGALKDYLRADLLNPQSTWVIRRIALCYRNLKQPEQALEYYHRYEALSPDNLSVQISIGHCHLELKDYNEALKYFYKVDYLDTKSHRAWRPIAWCSFLTGKYDQARNYYKKILGERPGMQDYLNAGHTEWALQNMDKAVEYYQKALQEEKGDWTKFWEQFKQDIPDLKNAGIEQDEIPLMLDELRYRL